MGDDLAEARLAALRPADLDTWAQARCVHARAALSLCEPVFSSWFDTSDYLDKIPNTPFPVRD